jgi:ABC-type multidrug transport system permease subunit
MKNSKLITRGILDSLGVLVYVFLTSLIISNGEKIFGSGDNKIIGPTTFLLFFVFSALLTGFLILGKPVMFYLDGAKKEGVKLLFYTGVSLFVLLATSMVILLLLK